VIGPELTGRIYGARSGHTAKRSHPDDVRLRVVAEHGLTVDQGGFRALMTDQRTRTKADARARRTGHTDLSAYRDLLAVHGPTDWLAYDSLDTDSRVLTLLGPDGQPTPAANAGEIVTALLDRTPFYAESGGQAPDAGSIVSAGARAEVINVRRPITGLIVHRLRVLDGTIAVDDRVHAAVDPDWRMSARQAHSGTHVVHAALRQVLGPTALRSGSYNRPGYLRLDFAWRGGLSGRQRQPAGDRREHRGDRSRRQRRRIDPSGPRRPRRRVGDPRPGHLGRQQPSHGATGDRHPHRRPDPLI